MRHLTPKPVCGPLQCHPVWKGARAAFNPIGAAWLHLLGAALGSHPFALREGGVTPPG